MLTQSLGKNKLTNIILEIIGVMSRRFVQLQWPELFPQLINELLNSQNMDQKRIIFECVKKICKKYRYMMRSDDLYREMNYVIENLSEHLIRTMI